MVLQPYLDSGQLALASAQTSQSIGTYYLVWPSERATQASLRSFRAWLGEQARTASEPIPQT